MQNEQRKRNLESSFEKEGKRVKTVVNQNDEALATTQRYHRPSNPSATTFTFLPYHLYILKSLYSDQDDKSAVWDDISDFLSYRNSLLRKNSNCTNLAELVQEATKVANEDSSIKYKSTSINITEPRINSKTSLSFITQSQQAQKLSLTSPFKSDIHDKALSTCSFQFQLQPTTRERYQRQHQHYYQQHTLHPIHMHGNYHRHNHQMTTSTTNIQSMNLVMALLRKQHQRSVDTAKKESQPFLSLMDVVRKEVQSLSNEINQLKFNHFENITYDEKSTNIVNEVLLAARKLDHDGKEEDNMNELSSLLCMRGLWKALGHSLETVLFQEYNHGN
jgi:hypothetical protein